MSEELKMQKIVEAAGECWHERFFKHAHFAACRHCGVETMDKTNNPSPTDLNELFRLAEKLEVSVRVTQRMGFEQSWAKRLDHDGTAIDGSYADTPAEALLNALYSSVKEIKP